MGKKSTTRTRQWKKYLLVEDVEDSQTESDADPDYKPPEYLDDSTDAESDISENELNDLVESMNKDLKVDDLLPKEAEKDDESPKEPAGRKLPNQLIKLMWRKKQLLINYVSF